MNLIVGGDFNCVMNIHLDNLGGNPHPTKEVNALNTFVSQLNLYDLWRDHNGEIKEFTWRHKSKPIMRRIDYLFANNHLAEKCTSCAIINMPLTDHKSVLCDIAVTEYEFGRSYWKFNNSLLNDIRYIELMNTNINNIIDEFGETLGPQCLWEYCKAAIKNITISYSKRKSTIESQEIRDITDRLTTASRLLSQNPKDIHLTSIVKQLEMELDARHLQKCKGAQIRSKQIWAQEGERNSKYFLRLEKVRGRKKIMPELRKRDGTVSYNQNEIRDEQVLFYKTLYQKKDDFNDEKCKEFIQNLNLPKLDDNDREHLDSDINLADIATALKAMKNDSSPGSDGLTAAWYKMFWSRIKKYTSGFF